MSGIQNKNLIFYSLHPNDQLSRMCLSQLDKMPELSSQFIRICVHHPQSLSQPNPAIPNLPPKVQECRKRGLIPILGIAGFNDAIFAQDALSWIKGSSLGKESVTPSNIDGAGITDNCSTIEQASRPQNSLFDTNYNLGFSNAKGEFNKGYANIDEASSNRIVTYDESNCKKDASRQISQRLEQLKFNRDVEAPQAPQRAGGYNMPNQGGYGMPNQGMPQMPQMPGMGGRGMPGGMPGGGRGMPGGGRGMPGMPQMPQMPRQGMPGMPQMGGMSQGPMMGGRQSSRAMYR